MYRFLLRPAWIAGHLLVIVTVVAFVNLGFWQLRRLDERQARNATIAERLARAPRPLDDVLATEGDDPSDLDLRPVEVTGRYVADAQVLTAPRTVAGRPALQVLSVLDPGQGQPALLVDRGWLPFDRGTTRAPPVPDDTVTVTGILRAGEPGDIGDGQQVARIAPAQIGDRLEVGLRTVYVQLRRQEPPSSAGTLQPTPLPERTEGSHLSYAVQWFSFALIVVIGYPVLVRRTARSQAAATDTGGSGTRHPNVTDSRIR